jgi:hypothetical protein
VSRFFDASRIFAKSARAEEDSVGKARSPREASQGESIAWLSNAPTNSHGSIVAGGVGGCGCGINECSVNVKVQCNQKWFDPGSNRGPSVC